MINPSVGEFSRLHANPPDVYGGKRCSELTAKRVRDQL